MNLHMYIYIYILYLNINKQVYLGIMKKCQTKEHHDNDKKYITRNEVVMKPLCQTMSN